MGRKKKRSYSEMNEATSDDRVVKLIGGFEVENLDDFPHLKELAKLPVYNLQVLDQHIKNYDKDPHIFDELEKRVGSDKHAQKFWFIELSKVWRKTESPEDAARLIISVFFDFYGGQPFDDDIEGFLEHYGLPSFWNLYPERRPKSLIKSCSYW